MRQNHSANAALRQPRRLLSTAPQCLIARDTFASSRWLSHRASF